VSACGSAMLSSGMAARFGRGESVQRCHAWAGFRQCKSLDKPNQSGVYAPRAGIGARSQVESTRTTSPVKPEPALKSAGANPGFTGEGGKRDLVLDVKSKDSPALIAVQDYLRSGALAGCEGLLVAVESGTAPSNETGGVFGGASLRPGVLRDRQLVRNDNRIRQRAAKARSVLPGGSDASIDPADVLCLWMVIPLTNRKPNFARLCLSRFLRL
jgi:hypothetical protein